MKPASFCVHSYDEADALRRLITSSLPFADLVEEWVVVDHRSADDTPAVLAEMAPLLERHGIALRTLREERDFSRAFTFAALRTATIQACRAPVVVLHDADFILGPNFRPMLERSVEALSAPSSRLYGTAYSVPVVWDRLTTDAAGAVTDHGRVWIHTCRPRIFRRGTVRYEQTKDGGRWEKLVPVPASLRRLDLTGRRRPSPALVSVNVKPPERIALRDTMTMFLQDAMRGRTRGTWLEDYRAGRSRSQGPYDYAPGVDLRGWRLHAPNLELVA